MSKRKTGAIPVNAPKEKKKMVIDMNRANLAKSYQQPGFRTGRHMNEKDRPRKKNWKKDYYGDPGSGSFFMFFLCAESRLEVTFTQLEIQNIFNVIYSTVSKQFSKKRTFVLDKANSCSYNVFTGLENKVHKGTQRRNNMTYQEVIDFVKTHKAEYEAWLAAQK